MLSNLSCARAGLDTVLARLREPRRHIQLISGARQVGQTTLALQAAERLDLPHTLAGDG